MLSCTWSTRGEAQRQAAGGQVVFLTPPLLEVSALAETSHLEGERPWFQKVTSYGELCPWFLHGFRDPSAPFLYSSEV